MNDLVNRERYTNSIDTKILNEFKKVSKDIKIPQSKLLDEALRFIISKYAPPK
jgi:hypothetical protein